MKLRHIPSQLLKFNTNNYKPHAQLAISFPVCSTDKATESQSPGKEPFVTVPVAATATVHVYELIFIDSRCFHRKHLVIGFLNEKIKQH